MTIVVAGGGSGGHITPLLAVAAELKRQNSDTSVIFIGHKGDELAEALQDDPNFDAAYQIKAGKLRRFHGEGLAQLANLKVQAKNIRDVGHNVQGLAQSWRLLGKIRPDAVFTRGGFICVPVALAARLRGIPYMTHDSDSTPSLANRLIAPWAKLHAVALEPELYPYPKAKTIRVGVPISTSYSLITPKEQSKLREELGLSRFDQLVCVTGGGNGAESLNKIVLDNAKMLLNKYPKLGMVHIAGTTLAEKLEDSYDEILTSKERERVIIKGFVNDLFRYSGAADVIVARGGATNLAEFAAQGKPCIIIPHPGLIWNVKNAENLSRAGAIIELSEEQAEQELRLSAVLSELLDNKQRREELAKKITHFAYPNSTQELVKLILSLPDKS